MTVVCSRCGLTKESVSGAPLPGALGTRVAEHVCQDCWNEWMQTSIRVINHYGLQPAVKEHREKIFELMAEFLKLPAE
ncbi:MAG TPA: Fe(2+)-trafficking protein [Candidatus Dormibacteraeota bacterium]|jgi:Fe-S cluster biosynthesis and repair protein YggX|nr:Fe(2+)-trafficking protein [Candidatus Dormibacteraeota bacterium]